MSKEDAVDLLMKEWVAGEEFRGFFEKIVRDYMGESHDVLATDLDEMRRTINSLK